MIAPFKVVHSLEDLRAALSGYRSMEAKIGFVPTMGALHEGHAALITAAAAENECTVVSIYVNPKQFGPSEDFAKYPRTLERDAELARAAGAKIVFAPKDDVIYPKGFATEIHVGAVASPLCGASRPGHFAGVATVVARLFGLVQPDRAYFGQKDLQQCLVVQQMVRDLALPVEIQIIPTVREKDGLAMSSRNRYLSPDDRERAAVIFRALSEAEKCWRAGESSAEKIEAAALAVLQTAEKFKVQYLEVRSLPSLERASVVNGSAAIFVAGVMGETRLIDNLVLGSLQI